MVDRMDKRKPVKLTRSEKKAMRRTEKLAVKLEKEQERADKIRRKKEAKRAAREEKRRKKGSRKSGSPNTKVLVISVVPSMYCPPESTKRRFLGAS